MCFGMAVFNSFLEKKEFTVAAALSGAIWWWTRPRLQPLCCQTGFLPLLRNPSTSHPIYSSQRGFINNVVMRAPHACGIWEALSQILRVGIWKIRGERWQTQWALIQTMGGFSTSFPLDLGPFLASPPPVPALQSYPILSLRDTSFTRHHQPLFVFCLRPVETKLLIPLA